jgi:hypothetical protein
MKKDQQHETESKIDSMVEKFTQELFKQNLIGAMDANIFYKKCKRLAMRYSNENQGKFYGEYETNR